MMYLLIEYSFFSRAAHQVACIQYISQKHSVQYNLLFNQQVKRKETVISERYASQFIPLCILRYLMSRAYLP